MTDRFILLADSGLSTIRRLIGLPSFDAATCLLGRKRMLRLFYLPLLATVLLAPSGCAGAARWLADDSDSIEKENRLPKPRAGSLPAIDDSTEDEERQSVLDDQAAASSDKAPGSIARGAAAHNATSRHNDPSIGRSSSEAQPGASPADSNAGDSLIQEVRALDFDDPQEEASALAALRAAPPQHRNFLLRTMQASAAVRRQHEARTVGSLPSAARLGEGQAAAGVARSSSNHRRDAVADAVSTQTPNRFAQSLADSSLAGFSHDELDNARSALIAHRRLEMAVDPNAVAVIEVEPAEALPKVVRPVSHSDDLPLARGERSFDSQQMHPTVAAVHAAGGTWQSQLQSAITALEAELANGAADSDRATLETKLRLLCVVADRRDEALRSRYGTSIAEQEFWSKEIFGLSALLDSARHPDARQRAAVAAPHLRQAAERLGEISGLVVKNLHFCTEVKGYGAFVPFPQDEFRLGQEVLLYCEVDNFQSKLTEKGYHTALKAHYQVFDSSGNRVADKDLGLKDEHCQNRRRDFFVPYFLWVPKQVPPGKYQLKLTLEDIHAGQTAEGTIEFGIREK